VYVCGASGILVDAEETPTTVYLQPHGKQTHPLVYYQFTAKYNIHHLTNAAACTWCIILNIINVHV